jgi:hypothetical protein
MDKQYSSFSLSIIKEEKNRKSFSTLTIGVNVIKNLPE